MEGELGFNGPRIQELWRLPVKHTVALFGILLSVWLLNSGHYTPMIIGFGVASCLLVVWLSRRMGIVDSEAVPLHLFPRVFLYTPWIIKEVFKANVDVARRALSFGKPNVSPKLFDTPATQKTDLGRVLYANSITITPGTVSIWVHGPCITVHAIAEDVADGLSEGEMDRRVTWLEGGGE